MASDPRHDHARDGGAGLALRMFFAGPGKAIQASHKTCSARHGTLSTKVCAFEPVLAVKKQGHCVLQRGVIPVTARPPLKGIISYQTRRSTICG